jgi:hypothetical protein
MGTLTLGVMVGLWNYIQSLHLHEGFSSLAHSDIDRRLEALPQGEIRDVINRDPVTRLELCS